MHFSQVRQVPDNQEVFAHVSSDQSIIFDILEYVPDLTDEKAIEYVENFERYTNFYSNFDQIIN